MFACSRALLPRSAGPTATACLSHPPRASKPPANSSSSTRHRLTSSASQANALVLGDRAVLRPLLGADDSLVLGEGFCHLGKGSLALTNVGLDARKKTQQKKQLIARSLSDTHFRCIFHTLPKRFASSQKQMRLEVLTGDTPPPTLTHRWRDRLNFSILRLPLRTKQSLAPSLLYRFFLLPTHRITGGIDIVPLLHLLAL